MFQMSTLLLFEDCNTLKYSEINETLQLSDNYFQKLINSLVDCKLLLIDGDVSNLIKLVKLLFTFL